MKINVELIKSFDPCQHGIDNFIEHHADFEGDALHLLELENVPVNDKLWLLLREEFIPPNDLHELACKFAESVLHIYEKQYPNDDRPRKAIEAKRLFIKGKITKEELRVAESAAWSAWSARSAADSAVSSAVRSAAESAARSAASSAARSAASSAAESAAWSAELAAWSAASSAARLAEEQKQLDIVKTYFEERK